MAGLDELNTQQVGKSGELLVQYKLLKLGWESAPMTTDPGIDLVAFNLIKQLVITIQVKASRHHRDATSNWVEWNMPKKCRAEYVAVVDIERDKAWLFKTAEFEGISSKTTAVGHRLWWYVPGFEYRLTKEHKREARFEQHELESVLSTIATSAATFSSSPIP